MCLTYPFTYFCSAQSGRHQRASQAESGGSLSIIRLSPWRKGRLPVSCIRTVNSLAYSTFSAYGRLSVRSLLNMREHLLNELDFPDPYINIKRRENEHFLANLTGRNCRTRVNIEIVVTCLTILWKTKINWHNTGRFTTMGSRHYRRVSWQFHWLGRQSSHAADWADSRSADWFRASSWTDPITPVVNWRLFSSGAKAGQVQVCCHFRRQFGRRSAVWHYSLCPRTGPARVEGNSSFSF